MSGAIMQLAAYGAQDMYLTSNPQMTFFKSVYRRHTNFAKEYIQQNIQGNQAPGNKVSVTLLRNGDLISDLVFHINLPNLFNYTDTGDKRIAELATSNLTHALFNTIELEIGGQIIDRHYGKWLTIWRSLTEENCYGTQFFANNGYLDDYTQGKELYRESLYTQGKYIQDKDFPIRYNKLSYNYIPVLFQGIINFNFAPIPNWNNGDLLSGNPLIGAPQQAYIPLCFWFCNKPGLALPLIALQYHEVKLNIKYNDLNQLFRSYNYTSQELYDISDNPIGTQLIYTGLTDNRQLVPNYNVAIKLYAEYIYLDIPERKKYAQEQHEYLIEQLQYQRSSGSSIIDLNFNHPVKELIWTGVSKFETNPNLYTLADYGSLLSEGVAAPGGIVPFYDDNFYYSGPAWSNISAKLVINGTDLFSSRNILYFTRKQIEDHHTGYGSVNIKDGIAVYSFSMSPEESQPSGSMNFSRLDNVKLAFEYNGSAGE